MGGWIESFEEKQKKKKLQSARIGKDARAHPRPGFLPSCTEWKAGLGLPHPGQIGRKGDFRMYPGLEER